MPSDPLGPSTPSGPKSLLQADPTPGELCCPLLSAPGHQLPRLCPGPASPPPSPTADSAMQCHSDPSQSLSLRIRPHPCCPSPQQLAQTPGSSAQGGPAGPAWLHPQGGAEPPPPLPPAHEPSVLGLPLFPSSPP